MGANIRLDVGSSIPAGYLVGRLHGGVGPAGLISIADLSGAVAASGYVMTPGSSPTVSVSAGFGIDVSQSGFTYTVAFSPGAGTINYFLKSAAPGAPVWSTHMYEDGTVVSTDLKLQSYGPDGTPGVIVSGGFGVPAGEAGGYFYGTLAQGTAASPTAVQSGDVIAIFGGNGYDGTDYSTEVEGTARFQFVATENYTTTKRGTKLQFFAVPTGTAGASEVWTAEADGGITVPSGVTGGSKGAGTINVSGGYYINGTAVTSGAGPAGSTDAIQYNAGGGSFGGLGPLTNGQLVIGSTGAAPAAATLTAGANVTITNGAGSITIAAASGSSPTTPGGSPNSVQYNASGAFAGVGPLTNGQLLIGSTGAAPAAAALTAGSNITITNAAGGITIASTASGTTTLAGDTDVNISAPANDDVLWYQTSDSKWHNTTLTAIMDAVLGNSQGSVAVRSASVWSALPPGTSGQYLQTLGASSNPQWAPVTGGGGGSGGLFSGVMSAAPTAASTGLSAWLNQGSASVSETGGMITIADKLATTHGMAGRTMSAPATPYYVSALVANNRAYSGNGLAGIGFHDGTKIHAVDMNHGNLEVTKWNSVTSFSASDVASFGTDEFHMTWIMIGNDGTNVIFAYSYDGFNWMQLFKIAKASGWLGATGYTNIMFWAYANGLDVRGSLLSWSVSGTAPNFV